jgi:hypothetical protein
VESITSGSLVEKLLRSDTRWTIRRLSGMRVLGTEHNEARLGFVGDLGR